jgi:hypothetical protein
MKAIGLPETATKPAITAVEVTDPAPLARESSWSI